MLQDYHTHTRYSFDGQTPLSRLIEAWRDAGVTHMAITDHADFFSGRGSDITRRWYRQKFDKRLEDFQSLKNSALGGMNLAAGVELGEEIYCPDGARGFLSDYDWDFVIGSLHYTDGYPDFCQIEYAVTDYIPILDKYFGELMPKHVKNSDFDVCGHITYPFREMTKQGVPIPTEKYYDAISQCFKIIIERGKGIEVNMSPCSFGGPSLPDKELLIRYRELGGEIITVGSDDHKCAFAPALPKLGLEIIKSAGFNYFTAFEKRKPQMIKF